MHILIMRHAATNADNSGTILGRVNEPILHSEMEDIKIKVKELQDERIDLVISSPLLRARQTATAIAEILKVDVREHEGLIERDFGILNGLSWDEFISKYPNEIKNNTKNYQPDLKGAESIAEVEERVVDEIESFRNNYHHKKLLIVTHSGVIRIILREFGHLTKEETRAMKINNLDLFRIELPD